MDRETTRSAIHLCSSAPFLCRLLSHHFSPSSLRQPTSLSASLHHSITASLHHCITASLQYVANCPSFAHCLQVAVATQSNAARNLLLQVLIVHRAYRFRDSAHSLCRVAIIKPHTLRQAKSALLASNAMPQLLVPLNALWSANFIPHV